MNQSPFIKTFGEPPTGPSTLVVTWNEDGGRLGPGIAEYLAWKLPFHLLAEVEPELFFPLAGVSIDNDAAKFPYIRFYYCPEKSLVVLRTDPPAFEWHAFLEQVLGLAQDLCHVKEVYTVGSMITLAHHNQPRQLLSVSNSADMKRALTQYDVYTGMEYQSSNGQHPSMASYVMWAAARKNMPGANLWIPIPFYLSMSKDVRSWKRALQFLNERLSMDIDLTDLDSVADRNDAKIADVIGRVPHLGEYMRKIQSSSPLTQEESEQLAREVTEALREEPN